MKQLVQNIIQYYFIIKNDNTAEQLKDFKG